jgi:hypothetical protein
LVFWYTGRREKANKTALFRPIVTPIFAYRYPHFRGKRPIVTPIFALSLPAGAADPGAWLKLADLTIAPLDADAAAAWSAAYTRTMTELERARPLQPNRIAHHLSGCIWPDAILPPADRHFKAKKKRTE